MREKLSNDVTVNWDEYLKESHGSSLDVLDNYVRDQEALSWEGFTEDDVALVAHVLIDLRIYTRAKDSWLAQKAVPKD